MPGVPSGRGCDGCRQQKKKKCDQLKPACSRCTRCKIACTGSGQQRYKFKEQMVVVRSTGVRQAKAPVPPVRGLSRSPSNETTTITSAFIFTLEVTDLRYDLSCYGAFLKDIPKRLGSNTALDASVNVLTSAFSSLYTRQQSLETLSRYVNALKALRICLNDPSQAWTANTLCAIYLLLICQGWIGKQDDHYVSHGEGAARLLSAAASRPWSNDFEIKMLITLCVPVIFESIVNPNIELNPWFDKLIEAIGSKRPVKGHGESGGEDISMIRSLARIPDFVRRPELHLSEVKSSYPRLRADCQKVHLRLAKTTELISLGKVDPPTMKVYAQCQAAYGLVLSLATIFNSILRAFDPCGISLVEDSASFVHEIITLAERASQFRPLAASYIPLCLMTGWAATDDISRKADIEKHLADYQTDLAEARWLEDAIWLKAQYGSQRLKFSTSFPENPLDSCEVDANAIIREPKAAMHANGSCDDQ